jgi:glucan biosynthesis protein C
MSAAGAPPVAKADPRESSLDAARAALLVLGVLLHVASVYAEHSRWIVSDPRSSPVFDWLVAFIHQFRMPGFFWISGFFSALAVAKLGFGMAMAHRLVRLIVPLAFAWFFVNRLQEAMVPSATPGLYLGTDLPPLFHLWFLVDLAAITPAAGLLLWTLRRPGPGRAMRVLEELRWPVLLAGFAVGAQLLSMLLRATGVAYVEVLGLSSLFRMSNCLPYFVVGFLMYHSRSMRSHFQSVPTALVVTVAALGTAEAMLLPPLTGLASELQGLVEYFFAWVMIAGVLKLAHLVAHGRNRVVDAVVAASYTIYLFHHLLVVVLGDLLLPWNAAPVWKYLLIVLLALGLTMLLHHGLIARWRLTRLLLNGQMK